MVLVKHLIGKGVTDSNGECSVVYNSKGTGDVDVEVDCMNLQEIYELQDCWLYDATEYSSSSKTYNANLPSVPFSIEFDYKPLTRRSSSLYVDFGADTNNRILFGQLTQAGLNGMIIKSDGNSYDHYFSSITELNTFQHFKFVYDGTQYLILRNNVSLTVQDYNISFDKVFHIEGSPNGRLKDLRIKPL